MSKILPKVGREGSDGDDSDEEGRYRKIKAKPSLTSPYRLMLSRIQDRGSIN